MTSYLIVRARTRACALPTVHVIETFRPLPCRPMPNAPDYTCGVARIRGALAPVLDLGRLLHEKGEAHPTRYVSIRVENRTACLAVEDVLGVRSIASATLEAVPPLMKSAHASIVSAIGDLDRELLFVLETFRSVPNDLWSTFESAHAS